MPSCAIANAVFFPPRDAWDQELAFLSGLLQCEQQLDLLVDDFRLLAACASVLNRRHALGFDDVPPLDCTDLRVLEIADVLARFSLVAASAVRVHNSLFAARLEPPDLIAADSMASVR